MTALMTTPLVLVSVPVLGATLGLALLRKPEALKIWLLLTTMVSLGSIGWASGTLPSQAAALPLLSLLPLMAFVSLLGQPLHPGLCRPWLLMMLMLGFGLGVLASDASLAGLFFLSLLTLVTLLLWQYQPRTGPDVWWEIGTFALGVLGCLVAVMTTSPISSLAFALACSVAFPLVPFHKGYVAALTTLPGNLPAFLALALPVAGFHGLVTVLPQVPQGLSGTTAILAVVGSLYGSLRAFTQTRMVSVVAYGGVALLSILWWSVLETRVIGPPTVIFLSAVAIATSGLLLASFALRARYGEIGLRGLSGLAEPMPRFAVILTLLALAAVGLPPFGVFAGFFGLLLAPSLAWSAGLLLIIPAWLAASWYLFDLVQGLLFGRQPAERRHHEDLRDPELAALTMILVLLVVLGVLPSRLFDPGPANAHRTVVMEFPAWNK